MMCCCAKQRKDGEDSSLGELDQKLKSTSKILIEFVTEEAKIGLKETPCLELVEKILIASTNQREIPKKDLIQIYKGEELKNQYVMKTYLIQDFFFSDNTRSKYNYMRVMLFNILYTGGSD